MNQDHQTDRTEKTPELDFRPLTQGLGFQPFSDGLPYAPISQTPTTRPNVPNISNGTGAIAAGAPTFVKPKPAAPAPSANLKVSVPVAKKAPTVQSVLQTPLQTAQDIAATPDPKIAQPTYGLLYLVKRTLAYLIDSSINISLCVTALSFALLNQSIEPEILGNAGIWLITLSFIALFNWALITAQEIAFGTSFGKRLFRLAIHGPTSAIFLRAFFFIPSVAFCGVGLLWALVNRNKRCWHDLIVDLQPSEIAKL